MPEIVETCSSIESVFEFFRLIFEIKKTPYYLLCLAIHAICDVRVFIVFFSFSWNAIKWKVPKQMYFSQKSRKFQRL